MDAVLHAATDTPVTSKQDTHVPVRDAQCTENSASQSLCCYFEED
jgi:hypothetical protein